MAKTLASAVKRVGAILGLGDTDTEAIYNASKWTAKRDEYNTYKDIYDGKEWNETTSERRTDTGIPILRYPLQINVSRKACRVHRAMLFGVRTETTSLPAKAAVDVARSPGEREAQGQYQHFVNQVWLDSDGIATMEEAGLLCQVYGGHFFKVAWEFWNDRLPWRIAVRSLKSPAWCHPVWDNYDEWNLLECYIGYYLDKDLARAKFGTVTDKEEVLYMEHWTRTTYKITVDDEVPIMTWNDEEYALEGENPWGIVPIVYIPHERDGGFYGQSLVKNLPGLARELNARLADKGDAVQETAHRLLTIRNSRTKGPLKARPIVQDGAVIAQAIDIGDAPPLQGAREPQLAAVESRGVPESVAQFTEELWREIRHQADIAAVAMGDEEIGSGRISGPVTSFRMYPSLAHTMTERANWSTGLNHLGRIMGTMAEERERSGAYKKLGVEPPGITKEMLKMQLKQIWSPMVPIERIQRVQELNSRLQSGGISLETYLTELGEDDPKEEITRIRQDAEWEMQVQAALGAKMQSDKKKDAGIQGEPGVS